MKNKHLLLLSILISSAFLSANTYAGNMGEFRHDLSVTINCDSCPVDNNRKVEIKLFADDAPVEGTERILDSESGFSTSYPDLEIFRGAKTPEEIQYDVRVKENGEYRKLPVGDVKYADEVISEWVHVSPENLEEGHEYVLLTENWNYEQNGYGKYVLVDGHLGLSETTPVINYRLIGENDNKSYYALETEPSDSDIWTLSKITSDDPDYELYPDTFILTNRDGKKLVLSDFDKGDWYDTIWRYSGKNGYNDSESSYNTNKMSFIPEPENRGRFRISAINYKEGESLGRKYLGINHFYQIQSQTEPEYAAQFLAFEKVETVTAKSISEINVEYHLCSTPDNPQTSDYIPYIGGLAVISLLGIGYVVKRNK